MNSRILAALMAGAIGLAGCGGGAPNGHQAAGKGVEQVKDALAALRDARTATITGTSVHRFLDSDIPRQVRTAFEGTYRTDGGPWGETVHVKIHDPDAKDEKTQPPIPFWDLGEIAVGPNFVFERDSDDPPPLPWRTYGRGSVSLNPPPLMAFDLLEQATDARSEGSDGKDGVALTKWVVTVPGGAANELFGFGGYPGTVIDCRAGFPLTVWIDPLGRLGRVRLVTEGYDGGTFDSDFVLADFGRPVGHDGDLPPQDQIQGSIDPNERATAKRAAEAAGAKGQQRPNPCAPTSEKPTGVDRSDCSPSTLKGFEMIDRLGRTAPGDEGTLHFFFKEPTPAPVAFDVPAALPVVTFGTKYIGPGGWELTRYAENGAPPGFDPSDQAAVRAALSRPEHGEQAPADVRLLTIALKGTWADLAVEASNCRYERATR